MQFGFQDGVGCIEASLLISETINHKMPERGSKIFSYFLDVREAFDTVWIDGLLHKLFTELGVRGGMWMPIKGFKLGGGGGGGFNHFFRPMYSLEFSFLFSYNPISIPF